MKLQDYSRDNKVAIKDDYSQSDWICTTTTWQWLFWRSWRHFLTRLSNKIRVPGKKFANFVPPCTDEALPVMTYLESDKQVQRMLRTQQFNLELHIFFTVKINTGSPALTTLCFTTAPSYDSPRNSDLWPVLALTTVVVPTWSCDSHLCVWQAAHTYNWLQCPVVMICDF